MPTLTKIFSSGSWTICKYFVDILFSNCCWLFNPRRSRQFWKLLFVPTSPLTNYFEIVSNLTDINYFFFEHDDICNVRPHREKQFPFWKISLTFMHLRFIHFLLNIALGTCLKIMWKWTQLYGNKDSFSKRSLFHCTKTTIYIIWNWTCLLFSLSFFVWPLYIQNLYAPLKIYYYDLYFCIQSHLLCSLHSLYLEGMAVRVVEFSSGVYKIEKIFA